MRQVIEMWEWGQLGFELLISTQEQSTAIVLYLLMYSMVS